MKKIKEILNRFHIHCFDTPILSQYRSFHTREIVYQCRCGQKELHTVHAGFSEPFPIETAMLITGREVQKVLADPQPLKPFVGEYRYQYFLK